MHHNPQENQHSESKVTVFIEHVISYGCKVEIFYLGLPVIISWMCCM